jgi:hypothetical protein
VSEARKFDGRFYAEDGRIFRSPRERKTPTGSRISMGFQVCTVHEALGANGATLLADILNKAIDQNIITDSET